MAAILPNNIAANIHGGLMPRVWMAILLSMNVAYAQAPKDPTLDCIGARTSDPSLAPLVGKTTLGLQSRNTFAMLADQSLASDTERNAIAILADGINDCVNRGEAFRKHNFPPEIVAVFGEAHSAWIANTADLYNRKISYGEYNRRDQALNDNVQTRLAAIAERIRAQQQARTDQAQAQNEAAQTQRDAQAAQEAAMRRQAAISYMLNQMRPYQAPQLVPYQMQTRPTVTTNCNWVGNQWTCTSR